MEALDQLYVNGWAGNAFTSAQAARNLIDLATGASLGALPATACGGAARPGSARALMRCGRLLSACALSAANPLLHLPASQPSQTALPTPPRPAQAGELGSLEEVVREFIHRQFLRPVMVHEVWEVAARAHAALEQGAAGADRCAGRRAGALRAFCPLPRTQPDPPALTPSALSMPQPIAARALRDLRAALAVLSMAAATRPEAFSPTQVCVQGRALAVLVVENRPALVWCTRRK